MKINKHIEIVRSAIPQLSSMGEQSCEMIRATLARHYRTVNVTYVSTIHDLEELITKQPDLVFLGMKHLPATTSSGNITWISEFLERNGIQYTGSTAAAIALDFNKPAAKQMVAVAGLHTASYFVAYVDQYPDSAALPLTFPLFVKPPNGGGGKGIDADSVVRDFVGFTQKVTAIAERFQSPALVEKYLPGREFSVAILEDPDGLRTMMPIELITTPNPQGDRILGQSIKAADTERVTAVNDEHLRHTLANFAQDVFEALGARDYGRIDIRLDELGVPHFLEANLIPGLAYHEFTSYFTSACWINEGMNYETMILNVVETGLSRSSAANQIISTPFVEAFAS